MLPKMPNHERSGKLSVEKHALRTSISREFIDHVRDVNSPKQVWDTLERLFSKKNTARLQFLENELAMIKQEELRQHNRKRVIVTGDNSTYLVAKEGAVKIDVDETSVKLDDVYHVPVLDNVKNVVADVILCGERKGSLVVMSVGETYVKKTSQMDSAATRHARLGHMGYQMLQQIFSKGLLDGLPTLKECS
ncbi:UNVERIFIED_CONTAM: hypothetical protein Scaly_0257000 [Sesamum calycinum]|uniref:GAG-pre-integrase domain-containing protein n=1 Tax=Sesamum calycinum TaxID=2727403 RepID=A0AAW2SA31_9LAMI